MDVYKKIKSILIALSLLFIIILVVSVILRPKQQGSIAVQVFTVPKDATILVNGKKVKNGTVYLNPATYKVETSKAGFKTAKTSVVIDSISNTINFSLEPVSDSAKLWANNHKELYLQFEGVTGLAAQKSGEAFYKKNPIANILPYDKVAYKIGYLENDDRSITLTIYARSPEYRSEALQQIRDWGYEPTNYRIKFIDFVNPLDQR